MGLCHCSERLVLEDEEDYPTPPVTPAVWSDSAGSTDPRALQARSPCPILTGDATAMSRGDQEVAAVGGGGCHENGLETRGESGYATNGHDPPAHGEIEIQTERASGVTRTPVARNGDGIEEAPASEKRSRLPTGQPAAQSASAAVHPTVVAGRISGSQMRAEMEDFFRDDEDDPDHRGCGEEGRGATNAHLREELASRRVTPLGTKDKKGSHSPNDPEGARTRGKGLVDVDGGWNTRVAAEPGGLLSEEFSEFLFAEDGGDDDNDSATPRRRTSGDVSGHASGSNLRTSQIPGRFSAAGALEGSTGVRGRGDSGDALQDVGSKAADGGGAEESVHHLEARGTGWKRAPNRAEFADFLCSDGDDSESGTERDAVALPSRRRPPRARRQSRETATSSGDGRSSDKWGIAEGGRAKRGDASRGRLSAASAGADAGSEPARSPGSCAVPCNGSGDREHATPGLPVSSPGGRAGLEEPLNLRVEKPPPKKGGESGTGTPPFSRESTLTETTIPPGGRAGGSGRAKRKTRETCQDHNSGVGSGVVGGLSGQGPFFAGGETSRWEVSEPSCLFSSDPFAAELARRRINVSLGPRGLDQLWLLNHS